MTKKKIVVALGGNALGNTPAQQINAVKRAADIIADLAADGHDIIIGHGNGPQVGMINLAMDYASSSGPLTPFMPLAECGAMSQGYIGYHLQQALRQSLRKRGEDRDVVSIVTQVLVDENDKAFKNPSKPVGVFYTKEQAAQLKWEKGFEFIEDAGRGYRRVVPSPEPKEIIELRAVQKMSECGMIVITVGGGGIPVVQDKNGLRGVDAVIDKDKSCSKLAQDIGADILLILTAVDQVCINFNKPDQKALSVITVKQAEEYILQGQFAPGSMLPKIEASLDFAEGESGKEAVITSLAQAKTAISGQTGTRIIA